MRENIDTSQTRELEPAEGSLFAWPQFDLEYTVEPHEDAADLYTFYTRGATDEDIITGWVSATEDSVVDITAIR
ncbi:DUF7511 domain-containing protein [Halomarina ordinaria]|uniref:DUF7511 domain-containing protein n=1 Tax=Halomarina ordinaria TaxID=3033939 RepID=A0ABD5UJB0_9EURY|nr:hypothetical protein [Halomarina sp. PSRA2]